MLEVLAVIAVVVYVIGRQLLGEPLRGKRVILLPVILTVIGVTRLGGGGHHLHPVDVGCLVVSGVIALAIGAGQGAMMRLENRDGGLWGRMPPVSLLLWAALVGSRVVMTILAGALNAHVAASTAPMVLLLGVNRLGQAALITRRAMTAGIPFAREKDGSVFLADRATGLTGLADRVTGRGGAGTAGHRDQPRPSAYRPDDGYDRRDGYDQRNGYDQRDGYDRRDAHGSYDSYDSYEARDAYRPRGHRDAYEPYEPYDRGGRADGRRPADGPGGGLLDGLGASLRDLRAARDRGRGRDRRSPRRYR